MTLNQNQTLTSRHPGFTLVELLIVIVVIAILAAISIIAYSGIQTRATETILKSDLKNAATRLGMIKTEDGNYPTGDSTPSQVDSVKSEGTKFQYTGTDGTSYCLTATSEKNSKAKAFHVQNGAAAKEGVCPGSGHTGPNPGGSGGGNGSTVTNGDPIQSLTSSQCSSLDTYTGSNSNAIITLKDSRGGTDQNYEVAKLADGSCWMLTNLKLGSTSSPITLTPSDSDVASNFTLPKLYSGSSSSERSYDNPKAYGPVSGNGSGATNYGYLYNWPAATAGESRTSHNQNAGNAPHSICPKGWRLPTGGTTAGASDFSRLDQAFGGNGLYHSGGSASNWNYSGPFKGVLSGDWWDGFDVQGDVGYLWSSSANPGASGGAFYADFLPGGVSPGDYYGNRNIGLGVRCLLN